MEWIYFTIYKWMCEGNQNSIDLYWRMERNTPENTRRFKKELNKVEGNPVLLDVRETKATKALSDIYDKTPLFNRSRGIVDLKSIKCEGHIIKYELNVCDIYRDENLMLLNPVIVVDTTEREGHDSYGRTSGRYYQGSLIAKTFTRTNMALRHEDEFLEDFSRISPSLRLSFRINIGKLDEEDILNDMCHKDEDHE